MLRYTLQTILAVSLVVATSYIPSHAAGSVMITTHVENFEMVGGNIGCPSINGNSAFAVDLGRLLGKLGDRRGQQLLDLIAQFEAENGVGVKSNTRTRNMQAESDNVTTSTTGPATGVGAEICELIGPYV